jgi:hypothetical protein
MSAAQFSFTNDFGDRIRARFPTESERARFSAAKCNRFDLLITHSDSNLKWRMRLDKRENVAKACPWVLDMSEAAFLISLVLALEQRAEMDKHRMVTSHKAERDKEK